MYLYLCLGYTDELTAPCYTAPGISLIVRQQRGRLRSCMLNDCSSTRHSWGSQAYQLTQLRYDEREAGGIVTISYSQVKASGGKWSASGSSK